MAVKRGHLWAEHCIMILHFRCANVLHFRCIICFRFFSGDVSSAVERVQKYQYMTIVDRHVIIFVEQPRPFVQNFASKGAELCKNMHLEGAFFSKNIAFEWPRLTATAIGVAD